MDLKNYFSSSVTTKAAFARSIGVSSALLHQWVERIRPVAPQHCPQIEVQTGGAVTRADLRPDDWHLIWPELPASPGAAQSAVTQHNTTGETA